MIISKLLDDIIDQLRSEDRTKLILRLTLLLLIFYSDSSKVLQVIMAVSATIMIANDRLLFSKLLWCVLSVGYMGNLWMNRLFMDNHKYLLVYWVVACFISLFHVDQRRILASNARNLIIITFFFATLWKLIAPEFLNGAFMEYILWTDGRVGYFKNWVLGTTATDQGVGDHIRYLMYNPAEASVALVPDGTLRQFAYLLSWLGIVVEGLIFLCYALDRYLFFGVVKNYVLFVFILFTYQLLPVASFGFTLAILGIAQLKDHELKSYLLLFFSIIVMQAISKLSIIDILDYNWLRIFASLIWFRF